MLLVEDNLINRKMLHDILSDDYDVMEAQNGQQALDILAQCAEEISIILLDIVMPIMDGYTFLSIVKNTAQYSSIPIIVTTHNDHESDEVLALERGATDFVTKPYKANVILHRVASLIKLRETAAMVNLYQYDRLTGLYTTEYFYQQARNILTGNPDKTYDIACCNIEKFKLLNDVFGIPAGDALIRALAQIISESVDKRGIACRLWADQFACMVERRSKYSNEDFERILDILKSKFNLQNVVIKWGICPVDAQDLSVEKMCDRAMLAAKSIYGQYGKHFAVYDDLMRGQMLQEQAITDGMQEALNEKQFEVFLQPQFSISQNTISGIEALVRWKHPEMGFLSPAAFIPVFEKNGFITKLDEYVWDRVCEMMRGWDEKGYPKLPVSVNVSRADVYNADLPDTLAQIIKSHALTPDRLHLEVTESAYIGNSENIISIIEKLRSMGFPIEMDDFGSGYSSLNMLNDLPIDVLKLDMRFVQNKTGKPIRHEILQFIIDLAKKMKLKLIAEGVETKEQLERLRVIGCEYVQGYYFAKPMSQHEFEALLEREMANV
ncbi:MAG: EAL domain-containing protein [Clostridia bacterium]|nr:EAL domain-containing protein [Clostridia bacterium]